MPEMDPALADELMGATSNEEILKRRADSLAQEETDEQVSNQLALLLFRIGAEWYAVRVSDVREIFQEYSVTPIPCVPQFILGVINIRGEILSVTDCAAMMGMGAIDMSGDVVPPAIVVADEETVTALVVDEIGDIQDVPIDSVEPPISIIDRAQAQFIAGSVHVGDSMVGLISLDKVLEPVVTGGRH
jgi:purine-binding chemotaxis protein CheW